MESVFAEPTSPSSPAIERETLVERCMGNLSFVQALLEELEATGRDRIRTIVSSLESGDTAGIAAAAHSLKGAASIMGALKLSEIAADVEQTADEGKLADLDGKVGQLRSEMSRCLRCIPTIREQLSASS